MTRRVAVFARYVAAVGLVALSMARPAAAAICVEVDLRFTDREPPAALVQAMQSEASSIWEPYGVWIQWSDAASAARCTGVQGSFDVFVERTRVRRPTSQGVTLGSTFLPIAAIDHAPIHVDQEATERTLASLPVGQLLHLTGRLAPGPSDVGRALGRVLAHEIGHVILAARAHQRGGLMRPAFRADDLISRHRWPYRLSSAELARLRQREIELDANAGY